MRKFSKIVENKDLSYSNFVKEKFNEEMKNESIELYNNGKRIDYIAEMLYDKYFNN